MVKRTSFNVITFGRNKIASYGLEFEIVSFYSRKAFKFQNTLFLYLKYI